jgi:hypothetical protein
MNSSNWAELEIAVSSWDKWPTVREHWERLSAAVSQPSFFMTSDWVDTWLSIFGSKLKPQFLLFKEQGLVVGACLLVRRWQWKGPVLLRIIYLNTAGEDPKDGTCIEYNDLLCKPGFEQAIAFSLASYLQKYRWDQLMLNGFQSGEGLAALKNAYVVREATVSSKPTFYINLEHIRYIGQEYEQFLSSNTRRQIRRSCELYQQQGVITLQRARDTDDALAMLNNLSQLHQKTWVVRGKPGVFSSDRFCRFHQQLIRNTFDKGYIQLLSVQSGSSTIGILYNFTYAGRVYFYQSGFDYTEDNRYKPGMVTHFHAVKECLKLGYTEYDFLAGDSQYKRSLSTASRELHWVIIKRNTLVNHLENTLRTIKRHYEKCRKKNSPGRESSDDGAD